MTQIEPDEIEKIEWTQTTPNTTLDGIDFFISFNASAFDQETNKGETALVKNEKYYILNGDWRKEYQDLLPLGFDECYKFFESKREEHGSIWTTPENLNEIT